MVGNGDPVVFSTTGTLPTGITAGTTYYVVNRAADTFKVDDIATSGSSAIDLAGSPSGTHTCVSIPYGDGDGSTTFNLPDMRGRVPAGRDNLGGSYADLLTRSLSAGMDGGAIGFKGGVEGVALSTTQIPSHYHGLQFTLIDTAGGGSRGHTTVGTHTETTSNNYTDPEGGSSYHSNVQPTIILNYIIKT
jgi:microcystin-dependent protein